MTEPDEALIWARENSMPQTYALARAYRAGQAASAERIKALEHDLMWTDQAWESAQEAVVYGYTLMDRQDARIKALEEEVAKANEPQWFYDDDADDEGLSFGSAEAAVEYAVFSALNPPPEGTSILEINTSRPCPSVWAVVKVFTDEEREAQDDDEEYIVTLCATKAEAEALLKEANQ